MALGGGVWTTQNKVLPGTYVNFTSIAKASATLSDRGFVAMPLMLDWGPDDAIFTVTNGDFQTDSLKVFGHAYTDKELLPLRELFQNAKTLYAYRLNGGGVKASNAFCTAKYSGIAGNKLSVVIEQNVDNNAWWDVSTFFDTTEVDKQTVSAVAELVANDFVTWKSNAVLEATAKTPLENGTNGTANAAAYQSFLNKLESYSFNVLGCPSDDQTTINLFVNYTMRMRDEIGAKFQTVIFNPSTNAKIGDYEGIIEIGNRVTDYDSSIAGLGQYGLVYWLTGSEASCEVNKSNTNKRYNGELTVNVDYTQAELTLALKEGRFMFHNVGGEVKILEDVNSLTTVSDTKGDVFKSNQTIRVIDQIANDMAVLFNTRYLGTVPNDADGRIALWNDIVKLHQELEKIRAVKNFNPDSVTVEQGDTKKAVVCTVANLNVVNAMAQLYMAVVIM